MKLIMVSEDVHLQPNLTDNVQFGDAIQELHKRSPSLTAMFNQVKEKTRKISNPKHNTNTEQRTTKSKTAERWISQNLALRNSEFNN